MPTDADRHTALQQLDARLQALGEALRVQDAGAVASEAAALQRALAALRRAVLAAGTPLPAPLRQRAARSAGQIAAQREGVARRAAALGRALDLLLPATAAGAAYSATGRGERGPRPGALQA
jgi:hypothetical protein